ncbi:hypothetical protein ACQKP8_27020 [Photobacterium alginatilyticum]|uniref:hypothetical protein n=1 Tax=Photobacterium alginatilyticum TaxID=1775171 RepID=UPI004067DFE5
MGKLIKTVVLVNMLSAVIIFILSNTIDYFATTRLSDFLFFTCIFIWGIAALTWEGGKVSRNYDVDYVTNKMKSMVSGHDLQAEKHKQYRQNFQFGLVMFIAGLPTFILCVVLQFIN